MQNEKPKEPTNEIQNPQYLKTEKLSEELDSHIKALNDWARTTNQIITEDLRRGVNEWLKESEKGPTRVFPQTTISGESLSDKEFLVEFRQVVEREIREAQFHRVIMFWIICGAAVGVIIWSLIRGYIS